MMRRFGRNERGAVSVEMAFVCGIMIMATLGAIEAGYAYHQHSNAQNAVRHGVRLAAVSDPVSNAVARAGGTFDVRCSGSSRSCSAGAYRNTAMIRIVQGPDGDRRCAATQRSRRGMCDVMPDLDMRDVSIRYVGTPSAAGEPDTPPLVTVEIAERPLRTVLIGHVLPGRFQTLPAVSASTLGEALDG